MSQLLNVALSGLVALACCIHHCFVRMLGANAAQPGTNSNNNVQLSSVQLLSNKPIKLDFLKRETHLLLVWI